MRKRTKIVVITEAWVYEEEYSTERTPLADIVGIIFAVDPEWDNDTIDKHLEAYIKKDCQATKEWLDFNPDMVEYGCTWEDQVPVDLRKLKLNK